MKEISVFFLIFQQFYGIDSSTLASSISFRQVFFQENLEFKAIASIICPGKDMMADTSQSWQYGEKQEKCDRKIAIQVSCN